MAKRQFRLDETQINELIAAYNRTPAGAVRTRLPAVRLYGTGYSVKEIIQITRRSRTSLMEWRQKHVAQVADLGARLRQYTPQALFGSEAATFEGRFWTVEDLRRELSESHLLCDALGTLRLQLPTSSAGIQVPAGGRRGRFRRSG
jgi:site-specific recombinase XerD